MDLSLRYRLGWNLALALLILPALAWIAFTPQSTSLLGISVAADHRDWPSIIGSSHRERYSIIGSSHREQNSIIGSSHRERNSIIGSSHSERPLIIGSSHS